MTGSGETGYHTVVHPAIHRLEVRGLAVRHPGSAGPVFRGLDLVLGGGSLAGLVSPSGAGKTTLLQAVAGLVPWIHAAEVSGTVDLDGESLEELDPGQRAHLLATALDDPASQLFLATPRQEVEAARRLWGDGPWGRAAVEVLGVGPLLDRRCTTLSSGERQRVVLAAVFHAVPRLLVLDEPTAFLDPAGARNLAGLLAEAAAGGGAALVAEQSGWLLGPGVDRWLALEREGLAEAAAPRPPVLPSPSHAPGDRVVLRGRGLGVERGGATLLRDVDLEVREGEVVQLAGPNGSGKTSLARVLAGLDRPAAGAVETAGRTMMAFPAADLQLFAATVEEEAASTGAAVAERARVLRRHGLEHLAARAPWTLSRGERQRLVHAVMDLLRPDVLILDEPAQGLDGEALRELVRLIHLRAEKGRAYLLISHREELARAVHRRLEVADGGLVERRGGP